MLLTAFPMISLILVAIVISLAKFGGHGIGGHSCQVDFFADFASELRLSENRRMAV